jgi:hypothetical protein
MSVNILIESEGGCNFTPVDFEDWAKEVSFRMVKVEPLAGPVSAATTLKRWRVRPSSVSALVCYGMLLHMRRCFSFVHSTRRRLGRGKTVALLVLFFPSLDPFEESLSDGVLHYFNYSN